MPPPQTFVATLSGRTTTPAQVASGVLAGCGALMLVAGLVNLVLGDRVDGIVFTAVGPIIAIGAALWLLRLRGAVPFEIRVDAEGIAAGRRNALRHWRWDDVHAIYVTGGVHRLLVVEDASTARARHERPRSHEALARMGVAPPLAATIPLVGMQPDEHAIIAAVREASGGRFEGGVR